VKRDERTDKPTHYIPLLYRTRGIKNMKNEHTFTMISGRRNR